MGSSVRCQRPLHALPSPQRAAPRGKFQPPPLPSPARGGTPRANPGPPIAEPPLPGQRKDTEEGPAGAGDQVPGRREAGCRGGASGAPALTAQQGAVWRRPGLGFPAWPGPLPPAKQLRHLRPAPRTPHALGRAQGRGGAGGRAPFEAVRASRARARGHCDARSRGPCAPRRARPSRLPAARPEP